MSLIRSNWTTLPDNLKQNVIYFLSPTSCHQVVELCKDANCGATQYRTLFKNADFQLPTNPSPVTDEDWETAYTAKCTELRNVLNIISNWGEPKTQHLGPDRRNIFEEFAGEWIHNKLVVLAALSQHGLSLKYISKKLQKDKKVVLAAVGQNGGALEYADNVFRSDPEVVLAAVRKRGLALYYAHPDLQKDPRYKEVMLAAVTENGRALQYACPELQNEEEAYREIVLAAVRQNGKALQFASKKLREDKEVVLAAVTKDGQALQYADNDLKSDLEIVLAAFRAGRRTL